MNTAVRVGKIEEETDDYLIELIGIKEDFPDDALIAYGKLYERYWEIMYKIALNICSYSRDKESDAQDLVSDTFNVIYHKKAKSFNKRVISQKNIRISITSWMKTIMECVHYDLYLDESIKEEIQKNKKENKEKCNPEEEQIEIQQFNQKNILNNYLENIHQDLLEEIENDEPCEVDTEIDQISKNIQLVECYLNNLSEREADIVRSYYSFYVPGKNTPSEELDFLEKKWGTTRDNIRRILKTFRDKFREDLKEKVIIRR
jgi:hypothetical protein